MKQGFVFAGLIVLMLSVPAYLVWRAFSVSGDTKVFLRLVDAGKVINSQRGTGLFLIYEPETMPDGGISAFNPLLLQLCNDGAPQVLLEVQKSDNGLEPKFIELRVRSGGMIGTQLKETFEWRDGSCV